MAYYFHDMMAQRLQMAIHYTAAASPMFIIITIATISSKIQVYSAT